jgi:hypothetical protein
MERVSYSLRCAIIVDLLTKLQEHGSWCGETHVQKATYISQDLSNGNFGYKFIMYKHGPFSFDLKDELAAMRGNGIIELEFHQRDYGPSIRVTKFGEKVLEINKENIDRYAATNEFVAKWLAASDVRTLEKLATAYYVTKRNPRDPRIERAKKMNLLKPHVDVGSAEEALIIVDEKKKQAKHDIHPMT